MVHNGLRKIEAKNGALVIYMCLWTGGGMK